MAKVTISVEFGLDDYFSKYGFGDGDDGASSDLGYEHRESVVDKLNEEFKKVGLPLKAEAEDYGSIHNNCIISVKHGKEYIEPTYSRYGTLTKKQVKQLQRVISDVDEWLSQEASRRP